VKVTVLQLCPYILYYKGEREGLKMPESKRDCEDNEILDVMLDHCELMVEYLKHLKKDLSKSENNDIGLIRVKKLYILIGEVKKDTITARTVIGKMLRDLFGCNVNQFKHGYRKEDYEDLWGYCGIKQPD